MQRHTSRLALAGLAATMAVTMTACGSGSGFEDPAAESSSDPSAPISVLIGSSGDAETQAVTEAVAAWSGESGTEASVTAASDLNQQLSQGFASGKPADVFYVSTDSLAGFAANGSLYPYGEELANKDDFYPTLLESFTYDDQLYCAPKDFSTLGLVINTDMWAAAGLTDADIPTNWEQLTSVATKLTTPEHVGLSFSPEYARVGAFMKQAGGSLLNADQTEATVDTAENLAGLEYVKSLLASGSAKFSSELGAGWGGEAFGKGQAAMTIEGNWIGGGLKADYPDIKYRVAELPAGPAGQGTLQFSNCWGIAADSPNKEAALALVEQLTSTEQQLAFSEAFGVMPSVESAAEEWKSANPDSVAFLDGVEYAGSVPTLAGSADVIKDFNSQLEALSTGDAKAILTSTQSNLDAVVADAK